MSETRNGLAWGLAGLLALTSLGEGGAQPSALILWHFALLGLLLAVLLRPGAGEGRGISRGPALAFVIYACLAVAGALAAPYGFAAWLMLLEIGAFGAAAWLAARCGPGLLERLTPVLLVASLVQSGIAAGQQFAGGEARPAGTFLNTNHLAGWLVAVLLLAWGTLPGRPRRGVLLWVLAGAPALAVIGVTGSRGALLGLVTGGVVLLVLEWNRITTRGRRALWGVIAIGVVLVGVLAVTSQSRRLAESDPFRNYRWRIWSSSARVLLEHPWTGTGPRQFGPAARNLQFADDNGPLRHDRRFSFPHSDLLRLGTELGWPGLAAGLAIGVTSWVAIRRRLRDGALPRQAGAGLAALAAIAAQGMVDHPSHRPALYLLGAVLWGALLSTARVRTGTAPRSLRVVLALLLVFGFVLGDLAPWRAWQLADGLPRGRLDPSALERLERATRLNPVHPDYRLRLAEHLTGKADEWGPESYVRARESAETAVRLQPADDRYRLGLARVEALACRTLFLDTGTRARAVEQFERAEALAAYDPMIALERAAFLLDTADPAAARRAAERALALEPEAALPRLILADAVLGMGGERAPGTARGLLQQAEEQARRWEDWAGRSAYAARLLAPPASVLDGLRAKIASADRPPPEQDSTPPSAPPYIEGRGGHVR